MSIDMSIIVEGPTVGNITVVDMDIVPGTDLMREGEGLHRANASNHQIQ